MEVVDELGARLRRLIADSVAACTTRLEVEREGLRAFFEFVRQHPNLYRVVRQAEFVDADCYRRYYDRFAKGYVRGLTQAMEAGEVRRMDPEALAYCLMGIGDFLGMRWVLWEEDPGLERVLDTAMTFLSHGLSTAPPAASHPRLFQDPSVPPAVRRAVPGAETPPCATRTSCPPVATSPRRCSPTPTWRPSSASRWTSGSSRTWASSSAT